MKRRRIRSWILLILFVTSLASGFVAPSTSKSIPKNSARHTTKKPMLYILEMTMIHLPEPETEDTEEEDIQTVEVAEVSQVNEESTESEETPVEQVEFISEVQEAIQTNYSSSKELYISYVNDICETYYPEMSTYVVQAVIQKESDYDPGTYSSAAACVGLMQVSSKWHSSRASKLGVDDLWDPYGNILVGVDYLNELYLDCGSIECALMVYNMGDSGYAAYNSGSISKYASSVLELAGTLESQGG
jgi:hypothetical protein